MNAKLCGDLLGVTLTHERDAFSHLLTEDGSYRLCKLKDLLYIDYAISRPSFISSENLAEKGKVHIKTSGPSLSTILKNILCLFLQDLQI